MIDELSEINQSSSIGNTHNHDSGKHIDQFCLLFNTLVSGLTKDFILFTKNFKQLFCIWIGPVPIFVISDPSDVQVRRKTLIKT